MTTANIKRQTFAISFHCFFPDAPLPVKKVQELTIGEIPKWIEAYKFTHPNCAAVSFKVWFDEEN